MDQNFDWAKEIPFRHDVWTLDFRFKPVRMIWVDVPVAKGQMQRKLIWYMVYSVTNPGKTMHPAEQSDGTYKVEFVDRPVRFTPVFLLESHTRMNDDVAFTKVYKDHLIPVAAPSVAMREDPHRRFFNSVEIGAGEIAVGKTAWGIATWEDVDPRTKWFSIYVEGLTNAYRWNDADNGSEGAERERRKKLADAYRFGDKDAAFTEKDFGKEEAIGNGRSPWRKVLKLNFWRPGDEYFEHEKEIRYGVPGRVDYEWVYR